MPNWSDFQKKHVLDPRVAHDCLLWNRIQWNAWLQNRLPNEFGRRRVDSVIVSTPEAIVKDYESLNYAVGSLCPVV